jgi:hypothetical protein
MSRRRASRGRQLKAGGYAFVPGSRLSRGSAAVAARELLRLSEGDLGALRPADVVRAARSRRNPLHQFFEWDDTQAAAQYRLEQARHLIRSVRVTIIESGGESLDVSLFIANPGDEDDQPYLQTVRAFANQETRQQLLAKALRELRSWRARYETLKELSKVFAAVDELEAA